MSLYCTECKLVLNDDGSGHDNDCPILTRGKVTNWYCQNCKIFVTFVDDAEYKFYGSQYTCGCFETNVPSLVEHWFLDHPAINKLRKHYDKPNPIH